MLYKNGGEVIETTTLADGLPLVRPSGSAAPCLKMPGMLSMKKI